METTWASWDNLPSLLLLWTTASFSVLIFRASSKDSDGLVYLNLVQEFCPQISLGKISPGSLQSVWSEVFSYSAVSIYSLPVSLFLFGSLFSANKTSLFQKFTYIILYIFCQNGYSNSSEEARWDPLLLFIALIIPQTVVKDRRALLHSGQGRDCHLFSTCCRNGSCLCFFFIISQPLSPHQM